MAAPFIGVGGLARKTKAIYIGVDGVAKRVSKAYVGVDGVAQSFLQTDEVVPVLTYVKSIELSDAFAVVLSSSPCVADKKLIIFGGGPGRY